MLVRAGGCEGGGSTGTPSTGTGTPGGVDGAVVWWDRGYILFKPN